MSELQVDTHKHTHTPEHTQSELNSRGFSCSLSVCALFKVSWDFTASNRLLLIGVVVAVSCWQNVFRLWQNSRPVWSECFWLKTTQKHSEINQEGVFMCCFICSEFVWRNNLIWTWSQSFNMYPQQPIRALRVGQSVINWQKRFSWWSVSLQRFNIWSGVCSWTFWMSQQRLMGSVVFRVRSPDLREKIPPEPEAPPTTHLDSPGVCVSSLGNQLHNKWSLSELVLM